MAGSTLLTTLLMVWGAITLVFGALLMWKYLVGMREENVVILDAAESSMVVEQQEIAAKLRKISGYLKIFGFGSLLTFLPVAGIFVYQGWVAFNGG